MSNFVYAESNWKQYDLQIMDQTFRIPYKITNGEIITVKQELGSLVLETTNDKDGIVEISIPRNLLDSRTEIADESFFLIVNKMETTHEETNSNPCFRTLVFSVPSGINKIEIIAAYSPEKPELSVSTVPSIQFVSEIEPDGAVMINGCMSLDISLDDDVRINVYDSNKELLKMVSITPDFNGTFSTKLNFDVDAKDLDGYTITATYGNHTAVPEFPLVTAILVSSMLLFLVLSKTKLNF